MKFKSPLAKQVYLDMLERYKLGLVDDKTKQEYDENCLLPTEENRISAEIYKNAVALYKAGAISEKRLEQFII